MDIKDYSKIVNAVGDAIRFGVVSDGQGLIEIMEQTFIETENFCKENIRGFKEHGKIVSNTKYNEITGELTNELEVVINGKVLGEKELQPYAGRLAEILSSNFNGLGVEEENADGTINQNS